MLKETEFTRQMHRELEPTLNLDAVVVGSGIMGLMIAKRLTDLGQQVALLEPQSSFASGSSIKNHGWLHRGTAHAISVKDKEEARKIVNKLIYGYEFLRSYAYECIEEPFSPIYALTQDDELAERALSIWDDLGVNNEQITSQAFQEVDPYIRADANLHLFKTADLKINNRMLFKKLVSDVNRGGGIVLKNTTFDYESEESIRVNSGEADYKIKAGLFVYATGANINHEYEKLTGENLDISYWKSHLIYLERFNPYSIVSLDPDEPIIINHLQTSVINRAYDEMETKGLDYVVDPEQIDLAFASLCRLYPTISSARDRVKGIACIKPSIKLDGQNRHSVNSQISQPIENHYFVLPGKMTEAPYVADELLHSIYSKIDLSDVSMRPIDHFEEQAVDNQNDYFNAPSHPKSGKIMDL